ncbi:TonB-dependent receptor plug domain-containing protein [Sphingomonas sp.]|uniref:TonB-dependent receptor plug domain-containing protein n=1 Tax=Sphingomonas sp. TaxID=28214 RepID=UPI00286E9432|nr:TonB-dependent receptor plug domain-containing protein [Sphingomonas sp.]
MKVSSLHRARVLALLASAAMSAPLAAQETAPPEAPAPLEADPDVDADEEDIVVVGQRPRGSVVGDIPPENTLTGRDVRATGATSIDELLEALAPQLGSARGRGGERPVLLLNGQRISGFRELRDIPTEAIQRVEILPEEVALKYGYRADQRVVNFVLRERFRSTAVRAQGSAATEGGYLAGLGDVTQLAIERAGRTTVNVHAEANGDLTESERDIVLQPLPANPELDPRTARTLIGSGSLLRGTATHNRQVLGNVSATLNAEVQHSEGRSLLGYPLFSDGSPLPGGIDPRVRNVSADSAHAGLALNWDKARWRWSVTGNADIARNLTISDPSDPDLSRDRSRSTSSSGGLDATANGPLFKLPAGDASATFRVGADTLHLDTSRRRAGIAISNSLGRTRGSGSINIDLPVSRRSRDFSALGNLTLNANAEVEQLSDFGTLTTLGAGLNWSPVQPLNLIVSWTREEGAPSVQQLGDPILDTPGTRIFDFTTGATVLANVITGGNPNLDADRRNIFKLGANWRPSTKVDLRLRADYVHSRLDGPISSFPGPSEAIEAAFPERFVRAACTPRPCNGQLLIADLRPVNFDSSRRDTLRWGFDFTQPLRSAPPSPAQIEQFRARRAAGFAPTGRTPPEGTPPEAPRPEGADDRQGFGGGGGFGGRGAGFGGGRGGGRQGGRLTFSLTHTVNLTDEVTIRPGIAGLDYLHGDALGSSGGRPRHEVEAQAGWSNNGLGARLSGNVRSATRVDSSNGDDLRFSPLATVDLRLFANLGERFTIVAKYPWLRSSQLRLEVDNIFDAKQKVRDAAGIVPVNYQRDLLDPQGRTIMLSVRKLFLPRFGAGRGSWRRP